MPRTTLIKKIAWEDPEYPACLSLCLGQHAPPVLYTIGDMSILHRHALALVCSVRCPGSIILATYVFATRAAPAGPTLIGGFHSPMERQCLEILRHRKVPTIVCPARSIEKMRLPAAWREALSANLLLILSPFPPGQRRATARLATMRNEFVTALAERTLIPHARPGSNTEQLARKLIASGKSVFTFHDNENDGLLKLGAKPYGGLLQQNEDMVPRTAEPWFGNI